ncbi:MAG: YciI family protein, partial [Polyangiaceae bacterium]
MKYLCLIYNSESEMGTMPRPEGEKMMAAYGEFTESIKKSGHYLGGDALQPTTTATTVRVRQN